jgi:ATP-dependent RNA helicase DeaD
VNSNSISAFHQLALSAPVLKALETVGYEKPSPIQASTIPLLLAGRDVLGQAQTGTGKTAAFALPALSTLDIKQKAPQVLVLAPTRELAIQVAEAFRKYASHIPGFHVLPVYGGQDYRVQTRALDRGVHVVVGTPGRIMDHMRRGNLKLNELKLLTLDEADEMLRMGFIDDVEWILEQIPESRQIALFSATMPGQIKRIATRYLNDPALVTIEVKTTTADTITQKYWPVSGRNKLDALTRILEAETFDAMLIFVRTKTATVELSEKLEARGYACAPLNGDIQQKQRERTVDQLKRGKLDIIVATDVAARGLDVERISHVLNYDIPYDTEAYVHRIGRTGRAGRHGDAILFVAPREKRMMQTIERATGQRIEQMDIPSSDDINNRRITRFKQRISDTIDTEDLSFFTGLLEDYQRDNEHSPQQIAAALAHLLQGDTPFLYATRPDTRYGADAKSFNARNRNDSHHKTTDKTGARKRRFDEEQPRTRGKDDRSKDDRNKADTRGRDKDARGRDKDARREEGYKEARSQRPRASENSADTETFRIEVGRDHGVQPSNIVGAIANEAGIDSQFIGSITINDDHSFVVLPEGMPKPIFKDLKKVWVCGQKLQISRASDKPKRTSFKSDDTRGAKGTQPDFDKKRFDKKRSEHGHSEHRGSERGKSEHKSFEHKSSEHRGPKRGDHSGAGKHAGGHRKRIDRFDSEPNAERSHDGKKRKGDKFGAKKTDTGKPAKHKSDKRGGEKRGKKSSVKSARLTTSDRRKTLEKKREESVAINKKRIRSIKAKREAGIGTEYVPAENQKS